LEALWGAIRVDGGGVPDIDVEPPVLRRDMTQPIDSERADEGEELEESPTCFLSYNFRDSSDVECIVEILEGKGHSVWFAGARIEPGQNINSEVIQAIENAERHFLYLSSFSLQSLWVGKEMIVGESRNLEQTIIVSADDPECMKLVRDWIEGDETDSTKWYTEHRGVSEEAARAFQAILMAQIEDQEQPIYFYSKKPVEDPKRPTRLLPLEQFPAPGT
jgi:hypothetical protein